MSKYFAVSRAFPNECVSRRFEGDYIYSHIYTDAKAQWKQTRENNQQPPTMHFPSSIYF